MLSGFKPHQKSFSGLQYQTGPFQDHPIHPRTITDLLLFPKQEALHRPTLNYPKPQNKKLYEWMNDNKKYYKHKKISVPDCMNENQIIPKQEALHRPTITFPPNTQKIIK